MIRGSAMNYNVKYCMIGTDGWNERIGFTNKDQMRAQAVRDMAASAEQVVVLTESGKFSAAGTVPLNLSRCRVSVLTDRNLPDAVREKLEAGEIEIITV
jgi:DeoR/GlpR family transcriptional regulator of sugar metabolism